MKTAIFDMDGLLIDSEPLWRRAEKRIFGAVGIALTDEMCLETAGLRSDEVVAHWFERYPWQDKQLETVEREVIAGVKQLILTEAEPMAGVHGALESLRAHGFKLGLASSSPHELILVVMDRFRLGPFFSAVCSAADEQNGKPHPAVYLTAAAKLGASPEDCLAFEDSVLGIRSAKSAGMTVVAVPAPEQYDDPRFDIADIRLRSLSEFRVETLSEMLNG